MKPICLSIFLCLICSCPGQTNPPENAEAVLLEDIALQEDQQQLKAQLNEKQKQEITLIGQARAVSIPTQKDSKVVQVVWTGVKGKDKKRASFKEPLISTFKSEKGVLSKGLKISLYGNKAHLSEALKRLEEGGDDRISEIIADNPSSNERRLEDIDGKVNKHQFSRDQLALDSLNKVDSPYSSASNLNSNEVYRGSPSSNENSKNSSNLIRPSSNSQASLSPQSTRKDFVKQPNKGFDPLKIEQGDASGLEGFKMPLIEVEITKEGCRPTIDLERAKVIVQTRSMTRKDGVIVSETSCADSDLIFDIKKDYGCCSDKVDEGSRVAYTTFRRYYLDEGKNKLYLDAECNKDESQPHPFIEEKNNCRHEIHLPSMLSYPQRETVYYDRSNARKVVKGCHRSGDQPLSIISTPEGCPLKHMYEQNKSLIQQREIFIEEGVIHEVIPCHEIEESIPHQFVKSGCKPLINGSQVTPMAKRQIIYKGKTKIIKDQCEPQDLTQLQSTREGCGGKYEHDYDSGRSYPLARHYYQWGSKNRFIDKMCRRSNQVLDHLRAIVGYEHVDTKLKSKPRYQISIKDGQTVLIIKEFTEKDEAKWLPYKFVTSVTGDVDGYPPYQQGEYIVFQRANYNTYTRPDNTSYKVFDTWISPISIKSVTNITNITQGGSSMSEYDFRASLRNDKK